MILLDTCSLIWLVADQKKLTKQATSFIEQYAGNIFVSSISGFEIGVKYYKKLLELPMSPEMWYAKALKLHDIKEIPVDGEIALLSTKLPKLHNDPADRIIIATGIKHRLSVITPDKHFKKYDNISIIW